jgi:hypothetical protein
MPAGRPSKYDSKFCKVVEDTMSEGFSRMAAAGVIGIAYNTFRAWMDEQPEFLQAVRRGQAKRAIFLERGLLAAETGPQVTSRIFALKNAAPEEWNDTQRVVGPGPEGEHIMNVSADEAFARIAGRLAGFAPGTEGGADSTE